MRRNTPRFKALEGSNGLPKDVVEPPKFITGKHVAAIFEKLGFDATCFHASLLLLYAVCGLSVAR
jgi:hypothetical protein